MNTNKYLTPTDIRLSLNIQLKPKMTWSISCLSANPKDLDEELHRVYHNTMSRMNINCKMKKEMRTIPLQYCGLGYFDLNIECLGKRFYFISRFWDTPTNVGRMMRQAFETFQLSLGLGGNIFERNYDMLGVLAEHCWFEHTWRLCYKFDVVIELNSSYNVPSIRVNDRPIMEIWIDSGIWSDQELQSLQCVRRFFKVFWKSDALRMDGRTIDPSMMNNQEGKSYWIFPIERPRPKDFVLWRAAIQSITNADTLTFQTPLGPFTRMPHKEITWFTSADKQILYRRNQNGSFDTYRKKQNGRSMRRPRYGPCVSAYVPSLDLSTSLLASVDIERPN